MCITPTVRFIGYVTEKITFLNLRKDSKMRNQILFCSLAFLLSFGIGAYAQKKTIPIKPVEVNGVVLIEDFNKGSASRNLLNGDTGSLHAPNRMKGNDLFQKYSMGTSEEDFVLRLEYDLTKKSGFVGYWSRLNKVDFSNYINNGYLSFFIKGDEKEGFPQKIKVELKSSDNKYKDFVMVVGISNSWKQKKIPLKKFTELRHWTNMSELVFVLAADDFDLDDSLKGVIYLDNISIITE